LQVAVLGDALERSFVVETLSALLVPASPITCIKAGRSVTAILATRVGVYQ
jgi:hypothetical protein